MMIVIDCYSGTNLGGDASQWKDGRCHLGQLIIMNMSCHLFYNFDDLYDDLYVHNSSTNLKVRQPKTGRIIPMVQPGMGSMQTGRIPFRLHDNHDHDSKMLMNTELICSAEVA